jgi:cytochrome P450
MMTDVGRDGKGQFRKLLLLEEVATPLGKPSGLGGLLTLRRLPDLAARIGIRLLEKPLRLGSTVIVASYSLVAEALSRDLDFLIQPINAPKFDQIGYHFILGMDRSPELIAERRALYTALARMDEKALQTHAQADITRRLDAAGEEIDLVEDYARAVAAGTAHRLFGIAPDDEAAYRDVARAIFGNSFLNVSGDQATSDRALVAANLLSDWFEAELARRRANGAFGEDMMGALLAAGHGDDLIRRTLGGMLVGAIDTTANCVAKIMTVLMADKTLLRRAHQDRASPPRMWGWCNEALRRWPHGPILLRQAACDTTLGDAEIKAGDKVILWTQAAMLDQSAFPYPQELRPDRTDAPYLHFGGGLHPCAGRGVNAWQIPMLVAGLLERNPDRLGRISWAGLFPAHLPVHFAETRA